MAQGVEAHVEVAVAVHRRALDEHERGLDPLLHHTVRVAVVGQDGALGMSVGLGLPHGRAQERPVVGDVPLRLAPQERIVLVQHEHGVELHVRQPVAALAEAGQKDVGAAVHHDAVVGVDQVHGGLLVREPLLVHRSVIHNFPPKILIHHFS